MFAYLAAIRSVFFSLPPPIRSGMGLRKHVSIELYLGDEGVCIDGMQSSNPGKGARYS